MDRMIRGQWIWASNFPAVMALISKIPLKGFDMIIWTLLDSIEVRTLFSFFAALPAIFLCAWCWNRIPIPLFGCFHSLRTPGKAFFIQHNPIVWYRRSQAVILHYKAIFSAKGPDFHTFYLIFYLGLGYGFGSSYHVSVFRGTFQHFF